MRTIFEVLEILANDPIGPNSLNAGPIFPTQAKDAEKEIIKSFNGSIELTKSDNLDFSGACFMINLPLRIF